MRKLGIVIALIVAATLGIAGTASAQQQVDDTGKAVACPPINATPAASGAAAQCGGIAPLTPDQAGLTRYVCGILAGMDKDAADGGAPGNTKSLTDQIPPVKAERDKCPTTTPTTTPAPPGGGNKPAAAGGGGSTVQGANAAADGGLPRTGGELFAGAGFALMSLGALVRRFLP